MNNRNTVIIVNTLLLIAFSYFNAGGYGPSAYRNSRPFERNPTTWVPPEPMRNGIYKLFHINFHLVR